MIELLTVHTYIENEVMYPEVRRLLPDLEDDVLESYEEHHVADVLCMELYAMSADPSGSTRKRASSSRTSPITSMRRSPTGSRRCVTGSGRKQLSDLGAQLLAAKEKAPRSPAQPSALKKTVDAILK